MQQSIPNSSLKLGVHTAHLARWLLALSFALLTQVTLADPPDRVARLSVLSGEVGFAPAGDDTWREASLNRPLVPGDRLYTERDARTELDLGTAVLRVDAQSTLHLVNLDNETVQLEVTDGTLNLTVRTLYDGQRYVIDTPTLTLVVREPGAYRIDARDGATQVTVFAGDAEVYGRDDAVQRVTAGQAYRFTAADLRAAEVFALPSADAFDDWCRARDERYRDPVARRYVSEAVIGSSELDEYGDWHEEAAYGPVWYPRRVDSGWAPYRDGHWAWVEPWGWTWVDAAPWGFAPSHYGRWVCVRERWGWVPGPAHVRPVYAPAMVAFLGGSNWHAGMAQGANPVGWYPLGPRDVYEPPYPASRHYVQNVNVTNIHNHTVINHTTINNVYNHATGGRPRHAMKHMHRDNPAAVTAVERDTFVNARPVARAHKRIKPETLQRISVIQRPDVQPTQASRAPQTRSLKPRHSPRGQVDVIQRQRPTSQPNNAQPLRSRDSRGEAPAAQHASPGLQPSASRKLPARAASAQAEQPPRRPERGQTTMQTARAPATPAKAARRSEPPPQRPAQASSRPAQSPRAVLQAQRTSTHVATPAPRPQRSAAQPPVRERANQAEAQLHQQSRAARPAERRREQHPQRTLERPSVQPIRQTARREAMPQPDRAQAQNPESKPGPRKRQERVQQNSLVAEDSRRRL